MSAPSGRDAVVGAGLLAGAANVIMQLSWPEVGHGVVESPVESGRLFDHPVKRTRTTLAYIAVATFGTHGERVAYRRAVNRAHAQVRSTEASPVRYHAMDPRLQLWVAACLYRGVEDTYQAFVGPLEGEAADEVYRQSAALGTTLQVREDMWPADRAAFERYWQRSLARVAIDDTVREYLTDIVHLRYLPKPLQVLLGPFNAFVTTGFLPEVFREQMRLPWDEERQRRFERTTRRIGRVVRVLPRPLRVFPYNAFLWDTRKRLRAGKPPV